MSPHASASSSKEQDAAVSVARSESACSQSHPPWRGVSLGGWLLLEPGTAHAMFDKHRGANGEKLLCEWDLMRVLRQTDELSAMTEHRESCISRRDFEKIKDMGLNAVRVPFGYWVVLGKTGRDPYHGPALEYLDRAVRWAEELGLQVVLDLHGAPGGESGKAPCGRKAHSWEWDKWRMASSLRALRQVALRYQSSPAVTGIAVCNEPSPKVPTEALSGFYQRAIDVIRKCGMSAERVTVCLPVFQRSLEEFVQHWDAQIGEDSRVGVCFEVHWYHCFENEWHGRTFAQHLRTVQEHAQELRRFPVVVGEWSLALGCGAYHGRHSREEMRTLFAHAQLAAYQEATHGWFFWNWSDHHSIDWDWQQAFTDGYLPLTSELTRLPDLPPSQDAISDPLEKVFDTPPSEPRIRLGDTVYLRAFNGRYLDVEGPHVRARYSDRGKWQQFVLCPFGSQVPREDSSGLCNGDVVSLLAHNNCYLGVKGTQVSASWRVVEDCCAFMVRTQGGDELRHRSPIFLQSCATSRVLAPNESEPDKSKKDRLLARWKDFGNWQRFVIEKPLSTAVTPHRPRRRHSFPGQMSCFTPRSNRRSSLGKSPFQSSTRHAETPASSLRPRRRSSPASVGLVTPLRRRSSIRGIASSAHRHQETTKADVDMAVLAATTPSRRRSSFALEDITATLPSKKRSSFDPEDLSAVLAATTPSRRRSSFAPEEPEELVATLPSKRRSSLDPEDLREVPTPSRRRRLSTKSKDLFATPIPKDLAAVFEEE